MKTYKVYTLLFSLLGLSLYLFSVQNEAQGLETTFLPTNAFDKIFIDSENITAQNFTDSFRLTPGSNISFLTNHNTHETIISATGNASGSSINITSTICSGTDKVSAIDNITGTVTCSTDQTSGSTSLDDLTDVIISSPVYGHIIQFISGSWINKLFMINTQSPSNDIFITGIDNQTGVITTKQFSVNQKTCAGTQKIYSINNVTGDVTCSDDEEGFTPTLLDDLSDVILSAQAYPSILFYDGIEWINKVFTINTQSPSNDIFITGIDNQTGVITTKQFSVNTIDAGYGSRIKSINNITGDVTFDTIDFVDTINCGYGSRVISVDNVTGTVTCDTIDFADTTTCSGTDKFSSYDNSTGVFTCTTDSTGSGSGGIPLPPKKWGALYPRTASADLVGLAVTCAIQATASFVYDTTDNSNAILSTTAVTDGVNGGIGCITSNTNSFRGDQNSYMYARWEENKITTNRIFIGFTSSATLLPNNADTILDNLSGIGLCIRTTDTIYQKCRNDGDATTDYSTLTTTENANAVHYVEVYTTDAGVNWCVKLDGGTAVCDTTEIPATTTQMYAMSSGETDGGATAILWTQYQFYLQNDK